MDTMPVPAGAGTGRAAMGLLLMVTNVEADNLCEPALQWALHSMYDPGGFKTIPII